MKMDTTFHLIDEADFTIPRSWVLTVRVCECGTTMFYDRITGVWHCLNDKCSLYKDGMPRKVKKVVSDGRLER